MVMRPSKRTQRTVAAAVTITALGAGVAVAYWTTSGSGTGSAAAGTVAAVTVVQTSTISDVVPGATAQTLSGTFNNPNSGPVYVSTVTASIDSVSKDGGAPAGTCDASDYTLANATMTVNAEVPAGDGVGAWTGATIAFNNKTDTNQDACQNATVTLAYSIP